MSKGGDEVEIIPPKGDGSGGSGGKATPIDGTPRVRVWSNSPPSSSNSSSKGRLTSSRRSSRSPKAENCLIPLHQMKRLVLHPKKLRARKEDRGIRNPTILLPLTMIICLPLSSSLWYPLVKPHVSMGHAIPNGDTR
jgi:hypothetical protein